MGKVDNNQQHKSPDAGGVELYSHEGVGYNPFLITTRWQVAQLNFQESNSFYGIHRMDIHHFTDEVFILTKGEIVLITASITDGKEIEFDLQLMKPNITYNVPAKCWHNLMMSEDAQVIIVENDNTHLWDFEFYDLSSEQKAALDEQVKRLLR